MPLAVFSNGGAPRLGKVFGDRLIDLSVAAPDLPANVIAFLEAGEAALSRFAAVEADDAASLAISDVVLCPPVPNPEKFLAIGMNYSDHAAEAVKFGIAIPEYQLWFNKQVSCITGPFDPVISPKVTEKLDYEAELAVVIGRRCRHVSVADARPVIGGYMVANDVSARDWQARSTTHTLGKSFDTHGPIGPWLTLNHEIADPHALGLRTFLNGVEKQNGSTGNMIYNIYEQISYLSTVMTLKPGDILSTGTPKGVGAARTPPEFVQVGDVMRVEVDGLGYIENLVVAEN